MKANMPRPPRLLSMESVAEITLKCTGKKEDETSEPVEYTGRLRARGKEKEVKELLGLSLSEAMQEPEAQIRSILASKKHEIIVQANLKGKWFQYSSGYTYKSDVEKITASVKKSFKNKRGKEICYIEYKVPVLKWNVRKSEPDPHLRFYAVLTRVEFDKKSLNLADLPIYQRLVDLAHKNGVAIEQFKSAELKFMTCFFLPRLYEKPGEQVAWWFYTGLVTILYVMACVYFQWNLPFLGDVYPAAAIIALMLLFLGLAEYSYKQKVKWLPLKTGIVFTALAALASFMHFDIPFPGSYHAFFPIGAWLILYDIAPAILGFLLLFMGGWTLLLYLNNSTYPYPPQLFLQFATFMLPLGGWFMLRHKKEWARRFPANKKQFTVLLVCVLLYSVFNAYILVNTPAPVKNDPPPHHHR